MKDTFLNDVPLDEDLAVLDLLVRRWGDDTIRQLDLRYPEHGPFVEVMHCRDFTQDEIVRVRVTTVVANRLREDRLVDGTPRWGWTDDKVLLSNERGQRVLWDARTRLGMDDYFCTENWLRETRSQ